MGRSSRQSRRLPGFKSGVAMMFPAILRRGTQGVIAQYGRNILQSSQFAASFDTSLAACEFTSGV
jgi:hypothetical protein